MDIIAYFRLSSIYYFTEFNGQTWIQSHSYFMSPHLVILIQYIYDVCHNNLNYFVLRIVQIGSIEDELQNFVTQAHRIVLRLSTYSYPVMLKLLKFSERVPFPFLWLVQGKSSFPVPLNDFWKAFRSKFRSNSSFFQKSSQKVPFYIIQFPKEKSPFTTCLIPLSFLRNRDVLYSGLLPMHVKEV